MSTSGSLYEVGLPADASSPSRARDFVRGHLLAHGLDHLVEDIRLVVSELATNAVTHAGSAFTVGLEVGDHVVLVSVGDFSPVVPVRPAGGPMDAGGRGLALVEALSTAWGTTAAVDSKTLWASFDCGGRTTAALG